VRIIDLTPDNEPALQQAAELLVDLLPNGWPTIESALKEVRECVEPGKIARVAVDGDTLLGWVGGQVMQAYEGNVWELHPIVVRRDRQRRGIGRALIEDLEGLVRAQGALTLYLGADDDRDQTSLSGVDLYPNAGREWVRQARQLHGQADRSASSLGEAHRTGISLLRIAAAEAALRGMGRREQAAPSVSPRRRGPCPQLGLRRRGIGR
jgi:aminoglycoside 6'-N-acetyltransferase I